MPRIILSLLVLSLLSGCEPERGDLLIQDITVLDGKGGDPVAGMDVIVNADTIAAIGKTGTVGNGIKILEGEGMYLLPGFIEMHAHALVPTCEKTGAGARFAGFNWEYSEQSAHALLQFGITTARSPSTPTALGVAFRDSIAAGRIEGPQFVVAGELITGRNRSPEAVREEIRKQVSLGVDYIKLYSQLQHEAVKAGIDEAHKHGIPVIGHLRRTSWTQGIEAGIDNLTHAVPWSSEMLDPEAREMHGVALRSRGGIRARIDWLELLDPQGKQVTDLINLLIANTISIDPTLVVYDSKFSYDWENGRPAGPRYRENPNRDVSPGLPGVWETCRILSAEWTEDDFRRFEKAWPTMLALVKRYHDEGVLLTTGSDTPNHWVIPGESLHQEMELLVEAGISPSEVLVIATHNGAKALDMLNDRGTIEVGKRADLVALSANPLDDISNTRNIAWVLKGGVRFSRSP